MGIVVEQEAFLETERRVQDIRKELDMPSRALYHWVDQMPFEESLDSSGADFIQQVDAVFGGRYLFFETIREVLAQKKHVEEFVTRVLRNTNPEAWFETMCLAILIWRIVVDPALSLSIQLFRNRQEYLEWSKSGFLPEAGEIVLTVDDGLDALLELRVDGSLRFRIDNDDVRGESAGLVITEKKGRIILSGVKGKNKIKEVIIPDNVTEIGEGAFSGCVELKSVLIPESVHRVCADAFRDCSFLVTLQIPAAIDTIPGRMLFGCQSLEKVELHNGITSIGYGAFMDCSSLKEFEMPKTVRQIGTGAFSGCSKLRVIDIPNGVREISKNTFFHCTALEAVSIPDSVEIINENAFSWCESLNQVKIPEHVSYIGKDAFSGGSNAREFFMSVNLASKLDGKGLIHRGILEGDSIRLYGQKTATPSPKTPIIITEEMKIEKSAEIVDGETIFEVSFSPKDGLDRIEKVMKKLSLEESKAMEIRYALESNCYGREEDVEYMPAAEALQIYSEFATASLLFSERNMMEKVLADAPRVKSGKLHKGRVQQLVYTGISVDNQVEELIAKSVTDTKIIIRFVSKDCYPVYEINPSGKTGKDYLKEEKA